MGGLGWSGMRAGWGGSLPLSGGGGRGSPLPALGLYLLIFKVKALHSLIGSSSGAATVAGVSSWTIVQLRFPQQRKHRPGSLGFVCHLGVTGRGEQRAEPQQRGPVLRFTS